MRITCLATAVTGGAVRLSSLWSLLEAGVRGRGRGWPWRGLGGGAPGAVGRLGGAARVSVVSGAAGSGKTVLLQSWVGEAGLAGRVAWVDAGRGVRDPQPFWLSVVSALRATGPGAELVRAVSAAPDLDGWALVERLLNDLAPLEERLWLVVDDVHGWTQPRRCGVELL